MLDQSGYHSDFKKLDADGNDKLTYSEVKGEKIFVEGFSKADRNKDNALSYDEYAAYKSEVQGKESKRVVSDSTITSKIKSKYLLEKGIKRRNQRWHCGFERLCRYRGRKSTR